MVKRPFVYFSRLFILAVTLSFAGWIFEKLGRYFLFGSTGDRGFLTLPLCPIYGISVVSIYLLIGRPQRLSGPIGSRIRRTRLWQITLKDKRWGKMAFYFIFVTLISTLAELMTGFGAKAFGVTLWDYSSQPLNLFGVICPLFSLLWGVMISAFMAFIWEPLSKLISRIPSKILFPLSSALLTAILIDFTVNIIKMII